MAGYDEVVEAFLAARDIEAEREDERTWIFRLAGEERSWLVSIVVIAQNDQVVVHGEVPVDVPPPRRADLATWAARANRGLPIGNFEVDVDTGGVWCKSSIDVEGDELSDALLDNLLAAVHALLERYAGPLIDWVEGRAPGPEEAVLVAEGFDP
jgi:hypothetical protein